MRKKTIVFNLFLYLIVPCLLIQPSLSNENTTTSISSPHKILREDQLDLRAEEKDQELLIDPSSGVSTSETLLPETIPWEMIESAKAGNFADQEKILMKALFLGWEDEMLKGHLQMAEWKVDPSYINHPLTIMKYIILDEVDNRSTEIETLLEFHTTSNNSSPLLPFYQYVYGIWKRELCEDLKGYEFIKKAADQGFALAQLRLGQIFYDREPGGMSRITLAELRYYLIKAVNNRIAFAYYILWDWDWGIYRQGKPQGMEEAFKDLERSAHLGYAEAQSKLGYALLTGKYGKEEDPVKGHEWLERAAKQGAASALKILFLNLYQGQVFDPFRGVKEEGPQDKAKAWKWLEKVAGQPNSSVLLRSIAKKIWPKGTKSKAGIVKCFLKAIRNGNKELLKDLDAKLEKIEFLDEGKHLARITQVLFEAAEQGDLHAQRYIRNLLNPDIEEIDNLEEFFKSMNITINKVDDFCETEGKWLSQYTSSPLIQASSMQDVCYNPAEDKFFSRNVKFATSLKEIVEHLGHAEMYSVTEDYVHFRRNVESGFMVKLSLPEQEQYDLMNEAGFVFVRPRKEPYKIEPLFYKGAEKQKPQFLRYYPKFKAYCLGEENVRLGDALMEMLEGTPKEETHTFKSYQEVMNKRWQDENMNLKKVLAERQLIENKVKAAKEMLQMEEGEEQQKMLTEQLESLGLDTENNNQLLKKTQERIRQIQSQLTEISLIKAGIINLISEFSSIRNDYLFTLYPWMKGNL